ncbi:MAG: diadenylate cyclase [Deltaproteobacteria bacterium]|nr:diadenylate cyclase [Deltaproteobacteria bacterium]
MFEALPELYDGLQLRRLVDVGLVAVLLYQLLVLVRGSRSGALLLGLLLLLGLWYVSRDDMLDLPTVYWVLDRFIGSAAIVLVILFQDDIRRALGSSIGATLLGAQRARLSAELIEDIVHACAELCERNLGALIVLEQQAPLDRYAQDGVRIGGEVSWQLLVALFIPSARNPTHDGAVFVQKGRITSAANFLPLAGGAGVPGTLGSRHRAAMGLADETDAVVVVVSEETATCAIAHMGGLETGLGPADVRERLRLLVGNSAFGSPYQHRGWKRSIVFNPIASDATLRPPASQRPIDEPEPPAAPRPEAPDFAVGGDSDPSLLAVDEVNDDVEPREGDDA